MDEPYDAPPWQVREQEHVQDGQGRMDRAANADYSDTMARNAAMASAHFAEATHLRLVALYDLLEERLPKPPVPPEPQDEVPDS